MLFRFDPLLPICHVLANMTSQQVIAVGYDSEDLVSLLHTGRLSDVLITVKGKHAAQIHSAHVSFMKADYMPNSEFYRMVLGQVREYLKANNLGCEDSDRYDHATA